MLSSQILLLFFIRFVNLLDSNLLLLSFKLKDLVFIQTLKCLLIAKSALEVVQHVLGRVWCSRCSNYDLSWVLVRHCVRLALIFEMDRIRRLRPTSWVRWSGWLGNNSTGICLLFARFAWSLFLFFGHFFSSWWCSLGLLKYCGHVESFVLTFIRVGTFLYLFSLWLLLLFVVIWRGFTFFKVSCAFKIVFITHVRACIHLCSRLEIKVSDIDHQRSRIRSWLFGTIDVWTSVRSTLTILVVTVYWSLSRLVLICSRACRRSLHYSFLCPRKLGVNHFYARIDRALAAHCSCIELRLRLIRSRCFWTLLLCFIPWHVLTLSWWVVSWVVTWILPAKQCLFSLLQYLIVGPLVGIVALQVSSRGRTVKCIFFK